MVISYFWGKKHYPIPYNLTKFFTYLFLGLGLYFLSLLWKDRFGMFAELALNNILIITYIAFILWVEKPLKRLKIIKK